MLHIAAMLAAQQMATAIGDTATYTLAQQTYVTAEAALFPWLWNTTYSYFRAYSGGDAIMVSQFFTGIRCQVEAVMLVILCRPIVCMAPC